MEFQPKYVFVLLLISFLIYSLQIYLQPLQQVQINFISNEKAIRGRLVWQKYNCQSCHQFYGLGGYLGPDLTNILSKANKGEHFVKAMIQNGNGAMPAYTIPPDEMQLLLAFFKMTDESGIADPRNFEIQAYGTIEAK